MKTYKKPLMTISEYLANTMLFESGNALSDKKTDWAEDTWL